MDYNYVNTTEILEALDQKDTTKVYKLLDTYFQQQQMGMPVEYFDISRIYDRLGKNKESEEYRKLGEKAAKEFDTGF